MKLLKPINLIVLCLLLVSCGPADLPPAESTPTVTEIPKPEIIVPEPWEGVTKEWTFFNSINYYSSNTYDPDGYLWLSSSFGIFRLDLKTGKYENIDKPESYDSSAGHLTFFDDTIWMVSSKGHVAHLENGVWHEQEIDEEFIYNLIATNDHLWLIGNESLYYLENNEWKVFEFPEEYSFDYYEMTMAGDGSLWFNSYDMVLQYDGAQWMEYKNLRGLNKMVTLANGNVLFLFSDVILVYDGDNVSPLVLPGEQYRYELSNSFLTPDGDFWFQIYAREGEAYTYLISDAGLEKIQDVALDNYPHPDMYVYPSLMTSEGWVYFEKNTIYLYDGQDWQEYPLEVKDKTMLDMSFLNSPLGFSPDGKLWFQSGNRISSYDGERVDSLFEEGGCVQYYDFGDMSLDGRSVWFGSSYNDAMCYMDLENEKWYEADLPFILNGMDIAPDGSVWVSSASGFIARITPYILRKEDYRLIEQIKIGGEDITTLLNPSRILVDTQGVVWVYVKDYGVYRYKDGEWKNFGMADIDQTSLAVDSNGDVWVGKPGKLFKHENGKWLEFPQACICPTNLTMTSDDVFWFVNGCNGVYMYNKGAWTQFTAEDLGGFTPSKILSAPDGAVWFFDYSHWTRYKPEE